MRNTGKRIITTSLAAVMIITALLGNGIEVRAADYSADGDLTGCEFESGDVISSDTSYINLYFFDGNDNLTVVYRNRAEKGTYHTDKL